MNSVFHPTKNNIEKLLKEKLNCRIIAQEYREFIPAKLGIIFINLHRKHIKKKKLRAFEREWKPIALSVIYLPKSHKDLKSMEILHSIYIEDCPYFEARKPPL